MSILSRIKNWVAGNPDLAFALLLAICLYSYFAFSNEFFATHRTWYAIMERFAVLGLVGLALTLCIIAGEIDLSIGSNAALSAVIAVRFTDSLGAVNAMLIALTVATLIGVIQGYFIAYLRVRAIVLTVGTLMLLRGVALFAAEEKTVMLTDFTVPDFISTKMFVYFSPASLLVITMFILVGLFMNFTPFWARNICNRWRSKGSFGIWYQLETANDNCIRYLGFLCWSRWCNHRYALRYRTSLRIAVSIVSGYGGGVYRWCQHTRWTWRRNRCSDRHFDG